MTTTVFSRISIAERSANTTRALDLSRAPTRHARNSSAPTAAGLHTSTPARRSSTTLYVRATLASGLCGVAGSFRIWPGASVCGIGPSCGFRRCSTASSARSPRTPIAIPRQVSPSTTV